MVYIHIIIIMGEEPTSALVDSKLFVTNAGWQQKEMFQQQFESPTSCFQVIFAHLISQN